MRKKVVFIVGTLQTGGIERSVSDWCLYLHSMTHWEPVVICLLKRSGPFLRVLEEKGIQVEECKLSSRGFVLRLKQLLKNLNPDVVHSQVAFSMPWQVLGILLSGSRRIIFTQQNEYQNWNPLGARLRLKFYFYVFFRFIDHYTCVSEKVRDSLCRLTGRSKDEFVIIPNSVNTDLFFPDPVERARQRQLLNMDSFSFVAGMVARFSPQKGHHYLMEAVRVLKHHHQHVKILLVGVGELEVEIRQLVEEYELTEYVVFYGQSVEVDKVLQAMDCFVLTSLWEGMPLALLEAMASGLPVIGTEVAGTKEVIQHEINGILIPSRDPQAIADALMRLKDDPDFRKRLIQSAVTFVNEKYSVSANMKSYIRLYEH